MNEKYEMFELKTLTGTEQEIIKRTFNELNGYEQAIKMLALNLEKARKEFWSFVHAFYPIDPKKHSYLGMSNDNNYMLTATLKEPQTDEQKQRESRYQKHLSRKTMYSVLKTLSEE